MYYTGMICGIVTQITSHESEAKVFTTQDELNKEMSEYSTSLRNFEVLVRGPEPLSIDNQ
jgi:hypothetical protein